ncbi:hypothetical protein JOQ06_004103, partial [Pogonophryne albipinna]
MENKPPSSHLPNSLVIEDTVVTGNERIAELFNQHFVKCGNLFGSIAPPKPPTNTPPPSPSSAAPCHSFCLQEVRALDHLDVLYHSAIRFATNAPYRTHHCDLYSLATWPSLETRRNIHWL